MFIIRSENQYRWYNINKTTRLLRDFYKSWIKLEKNNVGLITLVLSLCCMRNYIQQSATLQWTKIYQNFFVLKNAYTGCGPNPLKPLIENWAGSIRSRLLPSSLVISSMYSWPTGVTSGSEDMSTSERSHFSSFTDSVELLPSDFNVLRLPAGKISWNLLPQKQIM